MSFFISSFYSEMYFEKKTTYKIFVDCQNNSKYRDLAL